MIKGQESLTAWLPPRPQIEPVVARIPPPPTIPAPGRDRPIHYRGVPSLVERTRTPCKLYARAFQQNFLK